MLFVGDVSEDKKLIFLPTCIMLMSRSPLYHVQKEILSWYVNPLNKFSGSPRMHVTLYLLTSANTTQCVKISAAA